MTSVRSSFNPAGNAGQPEGVSMFYNADYCAIVVANLAVAAAMAGQYDDCRILGDLAPVLTTTTSPAGIMAMQAGAAACYGQ